MKTPQSLYLYSAFMSEGEEAWSMRARMWRGGSGRRGGGGEGRGSTVEEARALVESGFESAATLDGRLLFRKRK